MTRTRDDGQGGNLPESEQPESGDRPGESATPEELEADAELALLRLDSNAGPARALSERQLLLLTDRIERQLVQRQRSVRRFSPRRLVLAGGLFAASAAAAVYGVAVLTRGVPAPTDLAAPLPTPRATAPTPALPVEPVPPTGADSPEPGSLPVRPATAPSSAPEEGGAHAPVRSQERPAESRVIEPKSDISASARPVPPRSVVADRLASANALRARHRYREALAVYLQVIEIAPNGMQASVARVAAAEMQLEQLGDVTGAERLYREARTQGGELTAEAQFGLAQVARARSDAPGERQMLQDFLLRHPESPLVSAARRRLQALGAQ